MPYRALLVIMMLSAGGALAQTATPPQAAPTIATLAERQARRFPQPVRVADLIGRDVLQPLESQPVLGRVAALVHRADGGINVVVQFGGVAGIGARPIVIPIEAMALMGEFMAVMDFTPEQLAALPTNDGAGLAPVAPAETIRVGIVKPFH